MDVVVALAGNPNVGKSTVFNALTGLSQHTGNWPGKTVEVARGTCRREKDVFHLIDLPGCYSLLAHSEEEEVARDFICFEHPDAVVAVCDATCLERNMNLVLQLMETTPKVVLCVNLLDEAAKKQIRVNLNAFSAELGIPVIGTAARSGKGLDSLLAGVRRLKENCYGKKNPVTYPEPMEQAISRVAAQVEALLGKKVNPRWMAIRLLEGNESFVQSMVKYLGYSLYDKSDMEKTLTEEEKKLAAQGYTKERIQNVIAETFIQRAERLSRQAVTFENPHYNRMDRRLDWLFTSRLTGYPIMFCMLMGVFWITITGANVPSGLLADGFFWLEERIMEGVMAAGIPEWIYGPLVMGVYRGVAWVISVMLPPMAIFFPLFTLLEDFGYLPRIAFNLDRCFKKAGACGKQALTMCMGFGCNAAGVTACRIIDSPRERLIAILTNNFVPCNGRFPTIIAIITMFMVGSGGGFFASFVPAFFLTVVIVLGVLITLLISRILSRTILKGMPSSFTLEMPPYRRPQIGKVIVRSLFDRTCFVLRRAVIIAAPAGLVIWFMANINVGDASILTHCAQFLNPFAHTIGLDGYILMAFILGFPANEIVVPILLMEYLAQGTLSDLEDADALRQILVTNGWTWITAGSAILFSLMHWPCGTTCLTIRKETQSNWWTFLSFLIPPVCGVVFCLLFTTTARFATGIY